MHLGTGESNHTVSSPRLAARAEECKHLEAKLLIVHTLAQFAALLADSENDNGADLFRPTKQKNYGGRACKPESSSTSVFSITSVESINAICQRSQFRQQKQVFCHSYGTVFFAFTLPRTSTEGAFFSQVDYFRVARQPGAIAITSYKPTSGSEHFRVERWPRFARVQFGWLACLPSGRRQMRGGAPAS
jgi:hypothetical protein